MNTKRFISMLAGVAVVASLAGCKKEKEPVIVDPNLPIKAEALFMVGDATPNGWNIDEPTPLVKSEEDNLVFTWEGSLYAGEVKFCLAQGSWDVSFIRPEKNGEKIGKTDITDQKFDMWAGDPDNKWVVSDAGKYLLTMNLRNWTISTRFLGENEGPEVEPIETEVLYIIGDATPNGWSMDGATEFAKNGYIFTWTGNLNEGEMKACIEKDGSFSCPFIMPLEGGVEISSAGVAAPDFMFVKSPDNKWRVTEAGKYAVTFDLENWTIAVEYKGAGWQDGDPISTDNMFIIGDAAGGWSLDDAPSLTRQSDYVFVYEGELSTGELKAGIVRSFDEGTRYFHPVNNGEIISEAGVGNHDMVYTAGPDDKWNVTKAGNYRLTFDLEHYTIKAEKL